MSHGWLAEARRFMPGVGVEPTRAEAQRILSPPRLPFRHPGSLRLLAAGL
jgi:hypothetical protein